ncbi:hypothetical protein ES702_03444 [subsurface metagenome]
MKILFYKLFKDIDFKDVEDLVDKSAYMNTIVRIGAEQKKLDINFINRELEGKSLKNYEDFKKTKKKVGEKRSKKNLEDYM